MNFRGQGGWDAPSASCHCDVLDADGVSFMLALLNNISSMVAGEELVGDRVCLNGPGAGADTVMRSV